MKKDSLMNASSLFLDEQRLEGDPEADRLVAELFDNGSKAALYHVLKMEMKDLKNADKTNLISFLLNPLPEPDWFDESKISKGQLVFKKFAEPVMTLLGGLSLPYCYAGSPGNKALYLSDKMRQSPGKRLADTADFIIAVSSPQSFGLKGNGHISINRTRLIHAVARYYLLKSGNWNMAWGMPVNQEDMAGTNLAFSWLIINGLQKTGYMITEKEKENFLYLWRYIGYQLHINPALLPGSLPEAALLERTIRKRNFKKSEEGTVLARELIRYFQTVSEGPFGNLAEAQIRYWLGKSVADILELEEKPFNDNLVLAMNFFRESGNFRTDPFSYLKMLQNHRKFKKMFVDVKP